MQFASHLPNLRSLTQLRMDSKSHQSGQYPTKASSLWPDTYRPKDIAYRYALLIQERCPSLEYILIRYWAWQVIIHHDQPSAPEGESNTVVELRELEKDEILTMELFSIEQFAGQCGLSGRYTLSDLEEITEEQQNLADRIEARANEAVRAGLVTEEGILPEDWMDQLNELQGL